MLPAIVCVAFGVELYLKAIIASETGKATGHDLLKLFIKLSPQSKNALATALSYSEHDLRQKIGSVSSAFVDWRYVYELGNGKGVNSQFLRIFCEELENLFNKIKK